MSESDGSEIYQFNLKKPPLSIPQIKGMIEAAELNRTYVFGVHPENFTAEDVIAMQTYCNQLYNLHIQFCEGLLTMNELEAEQNEYLKEAGLQYELEPLPEKYL